jgi:hypothetical protein
MSMSDAGTNAHVHLRAALVLLALATVAALTGCGSGKEETRTTVMASGFTAHHVDPRHLVRHVTLHPYNPIPDPSTTLGTAQARLTRSSGGRAALQATFVIRGKGTLEAKGVIPRNGTRNRFPIVGGGGAFKGATGTWTSHRNPTNSKEAIYHFVFTH